jgi:hypothetical protein
MTWKKKKQTVDLAEALEGTSSKLGFEIDKF